MHVLFLNQYALPSGSAGITRHGDIGAELAARGHQVTVMASDYDYLLRRPGGHQRQQELTRDGVRFVWLQTGSYTSNDRKRMLSILRYSAKAAWSGARLRTRPDVIVGSSPHPLAGLAAASASRWLRVPWIFEARDIWPSALVDLGALRRGGVIHRGLELVERFCYRSSTRVVVVPPNGANRLSELGIDPRKAVHIPNFADLAADVLPMPESLVTILDGLEGKFVIAYAGAMGVPNGLEVAIDGMQRLAARYPQASRDLALLLVGGGLHREAIIQRAKAHGLTNVYFHEPIEKSAVGSLLNRADAGLMHTSASAHFDYGLSPNKLFHYLASAKPVLISSILPTIVDEVQAGIRYKPGSPDAFADAVLQLVGTRTDERTAMGERGRELVRTRYSLPTIVDTYERLLMEAAAAS